MLQYAAVIVWLLFVASSIMSGIALWVSEHEFRLHGFGVLVLLSPTFLGIWLYKRGELEWLLGTSIVGIIVQVIVMRKLAEVDS